ncbi:MAG: hypothetical protein HUJ80_07925, partial [Firmicutes bacterium]|nr:hypothetical protein [Bacillota bacterium]
MNTIVHRTHKSRVLALTLALAMCLSLVPIEAFAASDAVRLTPPGGKGSITVSGGVQGDAWDTAVDDSGRGLHLFIRTPDSITVSGNATDVTIHMVGGRSGRASLIIKNLTIDNTEFVSLDAPTGELAPQPVISAECSSVAVTVDGTCNLTGASSIAIAGRSDVTAEQLREMPQYGMPAILVRYASSLTVYGSGTLNVTGSDRAAAIGNAPKVYGAFNTIRLDGANINATGGSFSPAIGASWGSYGGGTVAVSNGTHKLTGGINAPALGAGANASVNLIDISGGTTYIRAGEGNGGVALGAGVNGGITQIKQTGGTVSAFAGEEGLGNSAIGVAYDESQSLASGSQTTYNLSGGTAKVYGNPAVGSRTVVPAEEPLPGHRGFFLDQYVYNFYESTRGAEIDLNPTVFPIGASADELSYTYTSSDPELVVVSDDGAVSLGSRHVSGSEAEVATVTVRCNETGVEAAVTVYVWDAPQIDLTITELSGHPEVSDISKVREVYLGVGDYVQLAESHSLEPFPQKITWKLSDNLFLDVPRSFVSLENGRLTCNQIPTSDQLWTGDIPYVIVSVYASDEVTKASVKVYLKQGYVYPNDIALEETLPITRNVYGNTGVSFQASAVGGTDDRLEWSSSDETILKYEKRDDWFRVIRYGEVTITARAVSIDIEKSFPVTVRDPAATAKSLQDLKEIIDYSVTLKESVATEEVDGTRYTTPEAMEIFETAIATAQERYGQYKAAFDADEYVSSGEVYRTTLDIRDARDDFGETLKYYKAIENVYIHNGNVAPATFRTFVGNTTDHSLRVWPCWNTDDFTWTVEPEGIVSIEIGEGEEDGAYEDGASIWYPLTMTGISCGTATFIGRSVLNPTKSSRQTIIVENDKRELAKAVEAGDVIRKSVKGYYGDGGDIMPVGRLTMNLEIGEKEILQQYSNAVVNLYYDAKEVYDNLTATQEEIDDITERLNAAVEAFYANLRVGGNHVLDLTVREIKGYVNGDTAWTQEGSWLVLDITGEYNDRKITDNLILTVEPEGAMGLDNPPKPYYNDDYTVAEFFFRPMEAGEATITVTVEEDPTVFVQKTITGKETAAVEGIQGSLEWPVYDVYSYMTEDEVIERFYNYLTIDLISEFGEYELSTHYNSMLSISFVDSDVLINGGQTELHVALTDDLLDIFAEWGYVFSDAADTYDCYVPVTIQVTQFDLYGSQGEEEPAEEPDEETVEEPEEASEDPEELDPLTALVAALGGFDTDTYAPVALQTLSANGYEFTANISGGELTAGGVGGPALCGAGDALNITGGVINLSTNTGAAYFNEETRRDVFGGILVLGSVGSRAQRYNEARFAAAYPDVCALVVFDVNSGANATTHMGTACGAAVMASEGFVPVNGGANRTWNIPANTKIYVPDEVTLDIEGTFNGDTARGDIFGNYFFAPSGYVLGEGKWPGKAKEETGPTEIIPQHPDGPGSADSMNNVTGFVGIIESGKSNGYKKTVAAANSIDALESAAKTQNGSLLAVFSAGAYGFRKLSDTRYEPVKNGNEFIVSIGSNGALKAVSINSSSSFEIVQDSDGVTVTGHYVKLRGPQYTIYAPGGTSEDADVIASYENGECMADSALAGTFEIDPQWNEAVFSVPEIFGCGFALETVAPLRSGSKLRFGGNLSISTPIVDIADISVSQLQINYSSSSVRLGGLEAAGRVEIPDIAGMIGGSASVDINTFEDGGNDAHFEFDVEITTPVVAGEFELRFAKARGAWVPDNLYLFVDTDPGIPLVPPVVVAYLKGGGLGFYNLADTINLKAGQIPPLTLRGTLSASVVDCIEGKGDIMVGLQGFDIALRDATILELDFLQEAAIYAKLTTGDRDVPGRGTYNGLGMEMGGRLELGGDIKGKVELSAGGQLAMGAFTGVRTVDRGKEVLLEFYITGELHGEVAIPKGALLSIWFIKIPWSRISAGAKTSFYMGASSYCTVMDESSVRSLFSQMVKNARAYGSITAIAYAELWAGIKGWVRVDYVIGKNFDFDYGKGSAPDLPVYTLSSSSGGKNLFSSVEPVYDGESSGLLITEVAAEMLASTKYAVPAAGEDEMSTFAVVGPLPTGVTIEQLDDSEKAYTAVNNTENQIFLFMESKEGSFAADQFTVTCGADRFDLTAADENTFTVFSDEDGSYAVLALPAGKSYSVSNSTVAFDISAIGLTAFATLGDGTEVNDGTVSYQISDMDDARDYAVQVYLCEKDPDAVDESNEDGNSYLLAETEKTAPETASEEIFVSDFIPLEASTGRLSVSNEGGVAPTGSYYLVAKLLEKVTATDENGTEVSVWSVTDTKTLATNYTYTNNYAALDAPESVSVSYAGGAYSAQWTPVDEAEGYFINVYDEDGTAVATYYTQ